MTRRRVRPFAPRPSGLCLALPVAVGLPLAVGIPGASSLLAILGIGFLIFIHEWGHYMACRITGTKTETFSVGFGPRLFGWEKDADGKRRFTVGARQLDPEADTMDFRVALIPLGGYVKMSGGEILGESTTDDPGHFVNKSASARILIVCAGVIMNIITAFVFYTIVFASGKKVSPPVVGETIAGGPAWKAGLEPGDRILTMGEDRVRSFYDVRIAAVFAGEGASVPLQVTRGGQTVQASIAPRYDDERGRLMVDIAPSSAVHLGKGDATQRVGFDEVVTVDGLVLRGGTEVAGYLQARLDEGATEITLKRATGDPVTVTVLDTDVPEGERPTAPRLVGLTAAGLLRVKSVRVDGRVHEAAELSDADRAALDAAGYPHPGDVLLRATVDGAPLDLAVHSMAQRLAVADRLDELVVQRAEAEVTLRPDRKDTASVRAWLGNIATAPHRPDVAEGETPSVAAGVLDAGEITIRDGHVWRLESSPVQAAGMTASDTIVKANGHGVETFEEDQTQNRAMAEGQRMSLTLRAPDGAEREIIVEPAPLTWVGRAALEIEPRTPLEVDGMGDAVGLGLRTVGIEVGNVFRTIGALFSGSLSFNKNIAGPITLVTASKKFADDGWNDLLWFLAYISVMLAVLNILPIPVLDGGHLLFILIEKIKGSPLKEAVMVRAMYVGLFLLLTLMFFAFKNDIQRLISG